MRTRRARRWQPERAPHHGGGSSAGARRLAAFAAMTTDCRGLRRLLLLLQWQPRTEQQDPARVLHSRIGAAKAEETHLWGAFFFYLLLAFVASFDKEVRAAYLQPTPFLLEAHNNPMG